MCTRTIKAAPTKRMDVNGLSLRALEIAMKSELSRIETGKRENCLQLCRKDGDRVVVDQLPVDENRRFSGAGLLPQRLTQMSRADKKAEYWVTNETRRG